MIRKVPGGWKVFSHRRKRKALSRTYQSKLGALRRLKQIRYFKRSA